MIHDLERETPSKTAKFDVCIIGAGAAGITLAIELLRHGKRVILIEGGGLRYEERSQSLYRGESIGLPYKGLIEGRVRVLGGTTTEWGGQIIELDDIIFRSRDWVRNSGWPITKNELAPYYNRASQLEGLAGANWDDGAVWQELHLEPPSFGDNLVSVFSRWCPQTNFASIHQSTLRNHPDLSLWLHTNACELIIGTDRTAIDAVLCRTLSGREARFAADCFVICMGGLETNRFLLQPRPDGGASPWNRNGLVGRYFQDHIACLAAEIFDLQVQPIQSYFDYVFSHGYKYHPKIKLTPQAEEKEGLLNVCGTVAFVAKGMDTLEYAYRTFRLLKRRRLNEIGAADFWHMAMHFPHLLWHLIPYHVTPLRFLSSDRLNLKLWVHCEQSPDSESRITLSSERDVLGLFRTRIDWRSSTQEISTIRRYVEIVRDEFTRLGLGRIEPDPDLFAADDRILGKFNESFHHLGGTRMANSAAQGVVDTDLRLFGTRNAYVCSTSVFPCTGFANPTHTLIALAVRLADHLRNVSTRTAVSASSMIGAT